MLPRPLASLGSASSEYSDADSRTALPSIRTPPCAVNSSPRTPAPGAPAWPFRAARAVAVDQSVPALAGGIRRPGASWEVEAHLAGAAIERDRHHHAGDARSGAEVSEDVGVEGGSVLGEGGEQFAVGADRSEERRVGKAWR